MHCLRALQHWVNYEMSSWRLVKNYSYSDRIMFPDVERVSDNQRIKNNAKYLKMAKGSHVFALWPVRLYNGRIVFLRYVWQYLPVYYYSSNDTVYPDDHDYRYSLHRDDSLIYIREF